MLLHVSICEIFKQEVLNNIKGGNNAKGRYFDS